MFNNLSQGLRVLGVAKPSLVLCSVLAMTACVGGGDKSSSSEAQSSSETISSSSVESSSSSVASSSIEPSSSSPSSVVVESSSSKSSSSEVSSSSEESSSSSSEGSSSSDAPQYGAIIPRTTCPSSPPDASHGSWQPHKAKSGAEGDQLNTVVNFKELMETQPVFDETGYSLPWYFHKPFQADGNPEALYPLVIYLHGLGESGRSPDDLWGNRHTSNFFASSNSLLTAEHQEEFPAYIVAPHCDCSIGTEWTNNAGNNWSFSETNMSRPEEALNALVDDIVANYQIDPARIYVTGISMGGAGSWGMALRRPNLIAAAVPLSGHTPDRSTMLSLIETKVPVWSHHTPGDENNSYDEAMSDVVALSADGACTFQTTYPTVQSVGWEAVDPGDAENGRINGNDLNHTVWPRAYTNPDLWPWVFAQAQPREGMASQSSESNSSSEGSSSSQGGDSSSTGSSSSVAVVSKPIAEVNFESNDLKRCIESTGATETGDLTQLSCRDQISSWGGIEEFSALKDLTIAGGYYNQPLIVSGLLSVETLTIDGPNVGTLDISSAVNLKTLNLLDAGRLRSVDISAFGRLETLVVASDDISALNISGNPNLSLVDVTGSGVGCNALTEMTYASPMLNIMHDIANCDLMPPSGVNHYNAHKASVAPMIDGVIDAVWNDAELDVMDEFWTFENMFEPSSPADLDVRFRALWDENYLYLLVEVTDDVKVDDAAFWQGDTVEIFIDEDRSGGGHSSNNQAFAYHINHKREVIDVDDKSDHVDFEIVQNGNDYVWEFRFKIYGEYGNGAGDAADALRKLYSGKIMGFTPSYIDNDGNGGRDHFVSTVFTDLHNDNQGYIDAGSFGTLMLVE